MWVFRFSTAEYEKSHGSRLNMAHTGPFMEAGSHWALTCVGTMDLV